MQLAAGTVITCAMIDQAAINLITETSTFDFLLRCPPAKEARRVRTNTYFYYFSQKIKVVLCCGVINGYVRRSGGCHLPACEWLALILHFSELSESHDEISSTPAREVHLNILLVWSMRWL